ncbi:MAG TPA: hypothetical protein VNN06_02335 [Ramlibacter sp.]|nr:hypothetical protein [Ramlibacter sp.]
MDRLWIARIFRIAAMWAAAGCLIGCGGYDVGPDPAPWSAPDDPGPQSSRR